LFFVEPGENLGGGCIIHESTLPTGSDDEHSDFTEHLGSRYGISS